MVKLVSQVALSKSPLHFMNRLVYVVVVSTAAACLAQSSCSSSIQPTAYAEPSVADGYTAQLLATGLDRPRSIVVDDRKQLLVSGSQISGLVLDELGCSVQRKKVVVEGDAVRFMFHTILTPERKFRKLTLFPKGYRFQSRAGTITGWKDPVCPIRNRTQVYLV